MTPLERAARAIADRENPNGIRDVGDWFWQQYLPHTRAVIEAIREPSEAMVEHSAPVTLDLNVSRMTWRAMIDALLEEGW